MRVAEAALEQALGGAVPDRCAPSGTIGFGQRGHDRRQEGAAQAADEDERLQKPAGKFNRRQQIRYVGHAYAGELAQKFDTVIVAKPRVADQDDVAGVTRVNPFVDDRSYVINVVIMTQKKKSFHVRVLIPGTLGIASISIILLSIQRYFKRQKARNCTLVDIRLLA